MHTILIMKNKRNYWKLIHSFLVFIFIDTLYLQLKSSSQGFVFRNQVPLELSNPKCSVNWSEYIKLCKQKIIWWAIKQGENFLSDFRNQLLTNSLSFIKNFFKCYLYFLTKRLDNNFHNWTEESLKVKFNISFQRKYSFGSTYENVPKASNLAYKNWGNRYLTWVHT